MERLIYVLLFVFFANITNAYGLYKQKEEHYFFERYADAVFELLLTNNFAMNCGGVDKTECRSMKLGTLTEGHYYHIRSQFEKYLSQSQVHTLNEHVLVQQDVQEYANQWFRFKKLEGAFEAELLWRLQTLEVVCNKGQSVALIESLRIDNFKTFLEFDRKQMKRLESITERKVGELAENLRKKSFPDLENFCYRHVHKAPYLRRALQRKLKLVKLNNTLSVEYYALGMFLSEIDLLLTAKSIQGAELGVLEHFNSKINELKRLN